jgi:hypothetical protein
MAHILSKGGRILTANGRIITNNYTPDAVDSYTTNLVNRLTAKGETPNLTRQNAMDKAIKSLRVNNLFENQFDVLVVTRGYGEFTTKENWIKDAHHALGVNNPTYTAGVGYNSDGSTSYLRTQYNPATQGILFTQNDATFLLKNGGPWASIYDFYNGILTFASGYPATALGTYGCSGINSATYNNSNSLTNKTGYTALSRNDASSYKFLQNSNIMQVISNSVPVLNSNYYTILALYYTGWANIHDYSKSTEKIELYAFGKSLTQQQFLTFQNIFNQYFLDIG